MKKPWRSGLPADREVESPTSITRSKTDSRSIRGRISNPIPILGPMDEEFPMRQPGSEIANHISDDPKEWEDLAREPDHVHQITAPPSVSEHHTDVVHDARRESENTDSTQFPHSGPTMLQKAPPQRTTLNQARNTRYSTFSTDSSPMYSSGKDRPQRKKSAFRGALSRLFGRKKKTEAQPSARSENGTTPEDAPNGQIHHRSDPSALNRPAPDREQSDGHQRSVSMPLTEYSRALRSHAIGSRDKLVIQSARNSTVLDNNLIRTRTGGSSLHFLGEPLQLRDGEFVGLSPRPASASGRISKVTEQDIEPNEIGRAITSGSNGLHRRSQSLSALYKRDQVELQRMSNDLRYWRASHNTAKSPIESSHTDADAAQMSDKPVEEEPETPVRPFAFVDIAEMAGMKITEAVSMNNRLISLEQRTKKIEKVVTQLCNAVPEFRREAARPTTSRGAPPVSLKTSRPNTRHSESSRSSFEEAPEYMLSTKAATAPRPVSTVTVRGVASLPSLSRELQRPLTLDHYSTLMALVETERSARQVLEAQVKDLRHQIHLIAKSPAYRANGFGIAPGQSFSETSVFDYDDDEEDEDHHTHMRRRQRGNIVPEDSGIGHTMDDQSDTWATPHEESHEWSPTIEDMDDDGMVRKKAARTMSLSQMTLNKTKPRLVNDPMPLPI